ncbi:hypothetical protein ACSXAC_15555 (plasmid) [Clostridium perfringens]|uniref:hypothetical protein n=1 Tax=Clostridium perfringens TaxID=1502 RepID=UPI001A291D20|nr:hypothetical protein [Clostridium perfringens]HAT4114591.1 hypothetical protein [Clostridium perfringens]
MFNKNKRCFFILIIILFAFNSIVKGENFYKINSDKNINTPILLAEIANENIFLYALDSDEGKGVYEEILLDVKGKQKKFNWIVDSGLSFRPELILSDINNDNKKELIIILTKWTGTETNIQEVHIFTLDNLEEIKVQDPLDIISKNILTKVKKTQNTVNINLNINGKNININGKNINIFYNESVFKKHWRDDLFFGNYIKYELIDGKLNVSVGAQVSFITYVGEVKIKYKFENNMLIADKIDFEVYDKFK